MTSAYIIAACRTAVAPRGGAFAALEPHALAAPVITEALQQAGLAPERVDEVIVSNALGMGGNPARSVALASGLSTRVAGLSIDRQCAGGMDAVLIARQMILSGTAKVVIAGGVESYSRRPLRSRTFADGRPAQPYEQAPFTPWPDRDPDMAVAAAQLGKTLGISRAEQDKWAIASHAKARASTFPPNEIVPLKGLEHDPFARELTPALCTRAKSLSGDVTSANTAVAADAAAFCIVVSEDIALEAGLTAVRIVEGATLGGDPVCPGIAPVAAVKHVLAQAGLTPSDINHAEVMEAFAVQAIACIEGTGIHPDTVNKGGGALARGHPIGASGAINTVRLVHDLRRNSGIGLATIAAAGGIATALVLSA
ncbi:Acetyl-CoA C-acetyltransferase [Sulfitobacter noctilucicola]|uniref:Acetyl-CoA C-acetyltransferase n=1 Tax=Sulfitobacter noctilucicola TaxID=1342301 RepID=A0A7W6M6J8_9RHOB|nr:thiolase family protein [Sulfitobacter noctilucicola]KIN62415.1 Acetyl-CoA C-acetyltransferase [Sulfitobacter noctilucicola]MBB4173052.1 acetyl-CoA C-acetyltransferase [Sulfitobacter noctilucicola]